MNEVASIKDRVVATHAEHPEWTAKQIADHLNVERYHVYNNARAAGIALAPAPPSAFHQTKVRLPTVAASDKLPDGLPVADFTVFADNPASMIEAQAHMVTWCDEKIAAAAVEQADARNNAIAGAGSGFSMSAWDERGKRIGKRIDFYEKVKTALMAGYYIVPPFPMDVFAIRTSAAFPRGDWAKNNYRSTHIQKEQMLPAGVGRYVNPTPTVESEVFPEPKDGGGTKDVAYYKPADFLEVVDFPFKLARAEVMNATAAAMGLRIFDRMGVLPARRSPDPIICGQILMPHRMRSPLTFFVTWWLDTKTL